MNWREPGGQIPVAPAELRHELVNPHRSTTALQVVPGPVQLCARVDPG
ncbi:hypothetical protein [Alkalilimnicola ehrlichii]